MNQIQTHGKILEENKLNIDFSAEFLIRAVVEQGVDIDKYINYEATSKEALVELLKEAIKVLKEVRELSYPQE